MALPHRTTYFGNSLTSRLGNVRTVYIDANDDDHECSAIA